MTLSIFSTSEEMGKAAGKRAAEILRKAIQEKGYANIILATGASQFNVVKQILSEKDIAWDKVTMFHLDEYIGLPISHPASFRKYLLDRFINVIEPSFKKVVLINGEENGEEECQRLGELIKEYPIDLAFVGFGENGHLAFNDPPADFDTEKPYIVVDLDDTCRQQQYGEGWFSSLEAVPKQAISMSIKQIMKTKYLICSVPDTRKAEAAKNCMNGVVSNLHPASILQKHPNCEYFLDQNAASLLPQNVLEKAKKS
ncbi:glucosamine-6-phosphate deaminase [Spirosomataceae bacterium TFI 002]|nr:glucosamine-6-phosphate deaminase [Spirosomataceae bacterium TFI 002]